LLIQSIRDVTIVRFRETSILDTQLIQQISEDLTRLIEAQHRRKVLLDFSSVKFLSSSALGVLVTLKKKADSIKGTLVISGMNKDLRKVFKITNLDKMFEFKDDESSALEVFGVTTAG
jgi:anti-sigma B factor antagonist